MLHDVCLCNGFWVHGEAWLPPRFGIAADDVVILSGWTSCSYAAVVFWPNCSSSWHVCVQEETCRCHFVSSLWFTGAATAFSPVQVCKVAWMTCRAAWTASALAQRCTPMSCSVAADLSNIRTGSENNEACSNDQGSLEPRCGHGFANPPRNHVANNACIAKVVPQIQM